MTLAVYLKNVLLFLVTFCWNREPTVTLSVMCFVQLHLAMSFVVLLSWADRRLWITLLQELYLCYYYFGYFYFHRIVHQGRSDSVLIILYFVGLSVSIFGFVFDIVDNNKREWIPRQAWPSQKRRTVN